MSRQPWNEEELDYLREHPTDWEGFRSNFPTRTYDSWEVKRRRVNGTAGTRQQPRFLESDRLAEGLIQALESYMERRRGRS